MLRFVFAILVLLFAQNAHAALKIDITKGNVEPLPVAIDNFTALEGSLENLGADIAQVVKSDLENCGLFRAIDNAAFLEKPRLDTGITWSNWRKFEAAIVLAGRVTNEGGNIKIDFKLWDPYAESTVITATLRSSKAGWRRIAHKIADHIYKYITGEDGFFDTRILYIAETGPAKHKIKRLAIMDQDGENHKFLTDGKNLSLAPSFDPKVQRAIYVSYQRRVPKVFILDIATGKQRLVGDIQGMSFAPRISPDGRHAALSVAKDGTTSIYEINLGDGFAKRILHEAGSISTSPSYSPNGQELVVNSDRGGSQQLYVMNRDGSGMRRISHGEGSYASPVWSPRGDYIAFIKQVRGSGFHLGLMRPDGSGERIITSEWLIENPSWAPNGMAITYSKQSLGGPMKIYAIDVTGYHERMLNTPIEASDPAWSPRLG